MWYFSFNTWNVKSNYGNRLWSSYQGVDQARHLGKSAPYPSREVKFSWYLSIIFRCVDTTFPHSHKLMSYQWLWGSCLQFLILNASQEPVQVSWELQSKLGWRSVWLKQGLFTGSQGRHLSRSQRQGLGSLKLGWTQVRALLVQWQLSTCLANWPKDTYRLQQANSQGPVTLFWCLLHTFYMYTKLLL